MNLIDLSKQIEERYKRYLKTTFYFKDPVLRSSFEEELDSGSLSKGPYLEATPIFRLGKNPRSLFSQLLESQPDTGFLAALQADRCLYQHQEQAIVKVSDGRNIVVATGTGSGKTECFLYPILLHLYRGFLKNTLGPGVRALILYPMNALANDQRERLGQICQQLKEAGSPFQFTFGRYIGETPENENDSNRNAREHLNNRLEGELVLRSEMRKSPPHILLTNYSMLEYLLLRPHDSDLFDNGRARSWKFIVLDEAHQYRGTNGIEMAMLLRRLKQRLREGGRSEPFTCIATSATLTGEEGDKELVANFASELFGESFHSDDIILGETMPITESGEVTLSPEDYKIFHKILFNEIGGLDNIADIAKKLSVQVYPKETVVESIGRVLKCDRRVFELRKFLLEKPLEVKYLAEHIFDDVSDVKNRIDMLTTIVDILLKAKDSNSGTPLLSARYHFFLRALEGAFVSYWPEKKIFLERGKIDDNQVAFEVAICRECGQHYFVGSKNSVRQARMTEAIRDPSSIDFGAIFFRPLEYEGEEETEDDESIGKSKKQVTFSLCLKCGQLNKNDLGCNHSKTIRVVREESPKDEYRADEMARCGACGYHAAGRDPVREIVYGSDGPNAVIATTLFQYLPEERKKILAFADSRQQAAFFAWYLEASYQDILIRNLIYKAMQQLSEFTSEGISLSSLANSLKTLVRDRKILAPSTDILELNRTIWHKIYREFLTDEQRISLEGVGLISWSIEWPYWYGVPKILTKPPWNLTIEEAKCFLTILLETMRSDRAVEIRTEKGVLINWADLGLQGSPLRVQSQSNQAKNQKGVRNWNGKNGKRAKFMAKLLLKINNGYSEEEALEKAVDTLRILWDELREYEKKATLSTDCLLLPIQDGRRINPDWYRVRLINHKERIFQCDTCGRVHSISVRGVCTRHRCPGSLKEISSADLEFNHYRILYQENLPGNFRVEEHTAQLENKKAREFQHDFNKGRIHVLSCSTTFELGVDLGDLDAIFLRNVPPEAFNYAQRVGRSGRRSGHPGFAVTYCRRSPHDLYHFIEPENILSGRVNPPVLSIKNEKIILRHIIAVVLSKFLRIHPQRFESVEKFYKNLSHPTALDDFTEFLERYKGELENSLKEIVPQAMQSDVGILDNSWSPKILGKESQFTSVEKEVSNDFKNVKKLEINAAKTGDYTIAKWARTRAKTIAEEDVLSFLSRKAVIPKYGFPVDVVELDTQRTHQNQESFEVSLERDLSIAISEFAPTSKIIANKKEWVSYGLKKVVEREWPRRFYKFCISHNAFVQWEKGDIEPPNPCGCRMKFFEYIIPRFGFTTNLERPKGPKFRVGRFFATRPFFQGLVGPDPSRITLRIDKLLEIQKACPGRMVVLCDGRRGEGFYICNECGAGFRHTDKKAKKHKNHYGQDCFGMLAQVSLGHEFVTDVLQVQFHAQLEFNLEPVWFAYSIAYALVEGAAEILDIPSSDLNATVRYSENYKVPPIVLYDDVPGGAGLVARLQDQKVLYECLKAAQKRVSGQCGCGESDSCYGCLRNYRNQFVHQYLRRGPVRRYLEKVISILG